MKTEEENAARIAELEAENAGLKEQVETWKRIAYDYDEKAKAEMLKIEALKILIKAL